MNKIQVTAQQRANALEALNGFWPTIKPEQVSDQLLDWRVEPDDDGDPDDTRPVNLEAAPPCGSIACFGGWIEWYAPFREQLGEDPDKGNIDTEDLHKLFGTSYSRLNIFASRSFFIAKDLDYCDVDAGFEGTDHELVSHRLRWLIENSEVVA